MSEKPPHGGMAPPSFIDFSSNLHPEPAPAAVLDAAREGVDAAARYPHAEAFDIRTDLGRHFDLPVENVVAGAGSSTLLYAILFSLRPRVVLMPTPCFSEYPYLAQRMGAVVQAHPVEESEDHFGCIGDPPKLERGTCSVLSNPGNPTGRRLSAETVRFWREAARRAQGCLIVDEAYADFMDGGPDIYSAVDFSDPSFIVLRSPFKFQTLPGLRAGLAFMQKDLASRIHADLAPWPLSTPAGFALRAVLNLDDAVIRERRRRIRNWAESFRRAMRDVPGMRIRPSDVHFFPARLPDDGPDGRALAAALAAERLQIRTSDGMPGLTPFDIRVSTRYPEENGKLISALKRVYRVAAARKE